MSFNFIRLIGMMSQKRRSKRQHMICHIRAVTGLGNELDLFGCGIAITLLTHVDWCLKIEYILS